MANNISGGMMPPPMHRSKQQALTDDQLQTIKDVLGQYDTDNVSSSDAQAIVEAFQEAGIRPGQKLASAMSEAGFDARNIRELAGVSGHRRGADAPQPQGESMTLNITDQMLQDLNKLLGSYYNGDLSDEDKKSTLALVKEIFEQTVPEGGLINVTA